MKRYLICSTDESVTRWAPQAVLAETAEQAVTLYLKAVYSKDETFRDSVLDLTVNMTFVERFYLASEHEKARFHTNGGTGTESEIIKARVRAFFAGRPELGETFVRYMETEDRSLINDDMFEYIVMNETDDHGFVALDPDSVPLLNT